MKKLKRIIVGIDIFEKSNAVLKRAVMIATQNRAELFLIHAVQTPWFSLPNYFGGKEINIDVKSIKQKIEKKIKALKQDLTVPYTILVKEGDAEEILRYESKLVKADMIIIGANRKKKKKFLGSTAENIAQQSHLPVLIVKNSVKAPYENIVVPTNFESESKQSILFARKILPNTKFKVINAFEAFYATGAYTADAYTLSGTDILQYNKAAKASAHNNLSKFMKSLAIKKGKILDGEFNSKDALLKYINKGSYDLVVVGSRGTTGVNVLLGSVSSSLLREVSADILIYVP